MLPKRFSVKILMINIASCVIVLAFLTYIGVSRIGSFLISNQKALGREVIDLVDNYYSQKKESANKVLENLYLDYSGNNGALAFIGGNGDVLSAGYIASQLSFESYVNTAMGADPDIHSIEIYCSGPGLLISNMRNASPREYVASIGAKAGLSGIEAGASGFTVHTDKLLPESVKADGDYTFAAPIKDKWLRATLGVILINYYSNGIEKAYLPSKGDLRGYVLLLTQVGTVIYDSSGRYFGKSYPYWSALKRVTGGSVKLDVPSDVVLKKSDQEDVLIAAVIPRASLLREINRTNQSMYLVAVLCLIAAVLLMSTGTLHFFKKISRLQSAMKILRRGNFSVRIPVKPRGDELDEISASFNKMADHLEEYVDKVYVANIRQKSAELRALQMQINPHFLYNTLDSIRMRAITGGDDDVADMIYLLSTLFRKSINSNSVITIGEELKYCSIYLDLFNIRYNSALRVQSDVDPAVLGYPIFRNLLQPIIENYMIHGFDPDKEDNTIRIDGKLEGERILICVEDNGKGIEPERLEELRRKLGSGGGGNGLSGGIGLINVNERIRLAYGYGCGIKIQSEPAKGTRILVRVKIMTKEELELHE